MLMILNTPRYYGDAFLLFSCCAYNSSKNGDCDMRITIGNRHDSKGNVLSDADFVELVTTTNAKMGYTKKLFSIPVYEPIEPSTL